MTLDVIILLSLSLRLCFILSKTSINHKCVYTSQISISLDMILIRTPNIDEAHEFIHYAAVNETYKRHNNNQHNIPRYNNIMCELPREKKISAISVQITLYVYIMSTGQCETFYIYAYVVLLVDWVYYGYFSYLFVYWILLFFKLHLFTVLLSYYYILTNLIHGLPTPLIINSAANRTLLYSFVRLM